MEKVIRIIDELILEAQKEPAWKAENALRCLKNELLKEQEEYVSIPFSWLVKFCTHIDFKEPMSNQERELLWRRKLDQQFGIGTINVKHIARCKDCKYLNAPANGAPFCKRIKKFVDADWFCADGEREQSQERR